MALSVMITSLVGCEQPCVLNTECASDQLCQEGKCLKSCESYYDCDAAQACYNCLLYTSDAADE